MIEKNEGSPKSWEWILLEQVADQLRGVSYGKNDVTTIKQDNYLAILRANNITDEGLTLENLVYVLNNKISEIQKLRIGDIVIAASSGSISIVGKAAQVFNEFNGSFGAFCKVIRPHQEINAKYLGHFFKTTAYRQKMSSLAAGANINNLKNEHIDKLEIPLPPLAEQKRIVAKLEALLTRSTNARNELAAIPKLIERYKQAVLAAAFRGDFTADWRRGNPESTDVENLKKEIEKHIKSLKRRSKIPSKHLLSSGIYPHEWLSYRLEEVCLKIVDGTHHTPEYRDSGVPFISVKDIRDGKIFFNDCKFVSKETHDELSKRCKPEFGDLLITKSGTIGRCAVIETNDEFSLFVSVALLKPFSNRINTNYLKHLMHYWIGTIDVSSEIIGSTIKNLHLQDMQALQVPVPSTEEQEEIVERVQTAFKAIDTIQAELTQAEALRKRLEQATLAKAFRGELVPQDPTDEPASVLLERIRTEREAQPKSTKGRRGKHG